jgi:hypothetical protein
MLAPIGVHIIRRGTDVLKNVIQCFDLTLDIDIDSRHYYILNRERTKCSSSIASVSHRLAQADRLNPRWFGPGLDRG